MNKMAGRKINPTDKQVGPACATPCLCDGPTCNLPHKHCKLQNLEKSGCSSALGKCTRVPKRHDGKHYCLHGHYF